MTVAEDVIITEEIQAEKEEAALAVNAEAVSEENAKVSEAIATEHQEVKEATVAVSEAKDVPTVLKEEAILRKEHRAMSVDQEALRQDVQTVRHPEDQEEANSFC